MKVSIHDMIYGEYQGGTHLGVTKKNPRNREYIKLKLNSLPNKSGYYQRPREWQRRKEDGSYDICMYTTYFYVKLGENGEVPNINDAEWDYKNDVRNRVLCGGRKKKRRRKTKRKTKRKRKRKSKRKSKRRRKRKSKRRR